MTSGPAAAPALEPSSSDGPSAGPAGSVAAAPDAALDASIPLLPITFSMSPSPSGASAPGPASNGAANAPPPPIIAQPLRAKPNGVPTPANIGAATCFRPTAQPQPNKASRVPNPINLTAPLVYTAITHFEPSSCPSTVPPAGSDSPEHEPEPFECDAQPSVHHSLQHHAANYRSGRPPTPASDPCSRATACPGARAGSSSSGSEPGSVGCNPVPATHHCLQCVAWRPCNGACARTHWRCIDGSHACSDTRRPSCIVSSAGTGSPGSEPGAVECQPSSAAHHLIGCCQLCAAHGGKPSACAHPWGIHQPTATAHICRGTWWVQFNVAWADSRCWFSFCSSSRKSLSRAPFSGYSRAGHRTLCRGHLPDRHGCPECQSQPATRIVSSHRRPGPGW